MNLRKVKPEEVKIRKALLQDLQSQVKQAHLKVLSKHIGALRGAAEPKSEGPSDLDAVVDADVPAVVHKGAEPERGPSEPEDADFDSEEGKDEPDGDEAADSDEECKVPAGKPSLSDMISKLSRGK